jgi:hypothetical protein
MEAAQTSRLNRHQERPDKLRQAFLNDFSPGEKPKNSKNWMRTYTCYTMLCHAASCAVKIK